MSVQAHGSMDSLSAHSPKNPSKSKSSKVQFDDNDDDDDASIIQQRLAKSHMVRALLYSNGARAKLPKVKKQILVAKSPFTINEPTDFPDKPFTLHTTQAPGAHSEQFFNSVWLSAPGPTNKKDNELVMTNSVLMAKSVEVDQMPGQPPWYIGYQNKINPPDSSIIYAASRYGFRGSKSIRQYKTEPYQSAERTQTQYTPKFLDCSFRINEWVPNIRAANLEDNQSTPKVWPENTEYANGSKLKRPPSSVRYNRETTIGNDGNRHIPPSLSNYVDRCVDVDRTLHDFAKMESSNTFLSAPMTAQLKFETMWNDRVNKNASQPLRATLKTEYAPFQGG